MNFVLIYKIFLCLYITLDLQLPAIPARPAAPATMSAIRARLNATVEDLGAVGRDSLYGYGLVDADRAVLKQATVPTVTKVTGIGYRSRKVNSVVDPVNHLSWDGISPLNSFKQK